MFVEIEAKLKVDSFEDVKRQLAACGARHVSQMVQVDCYFDTGDRRLTETDRCLRLRTERSGDRERVVLTYKGPKQAGDFKKREEEGEHEVVCLPPRRPKTAKNPDL